MLQGGLRCQQVVFLGKYRSKTPANWEFYAYSSIDIRSMNVGKPKDFYCTMILKYLWAVLLRFYQYVNHNSSKILYTRPLITSVFKLENYLCLHSTTESQKVGTIITHMNSQSDKTFMESQKTNVITCECQSVNEKGDFAPSCKCHKWDYCYYSYIPLTKA